MCVSTVAELSSALTCSSRGILRTPRKTKRCSDTHTSTWVNTRTSQHKHSPHIVREAHEAWRRRAPHHMITQMSLRISDGFVRQLFCLITHSLYSSSPSNSAFCIASAYSSGSISQYMMLPRLSSVTFLTQQHSTQGKAEQTKPQNRMLDSATATFSRVHGLSFRTVGQCAIPVSGFLSFLQLGYTLLFLLSFHSSAGPRRGRSLLPGGVLLECRHKWLEHHLCPLMPSSI